MTGVAGKSGVFFVGGDTQRGCRYGSYLDESCSKNVVETVISDGAITQVVSGSA